MREKLYCAQFVKKLIFASCFVRFFQEVVLLPAVQFLAAKDKFLSVFRAKKETTFCGSIVRKPDYIRVCNFLPGWFVGKGGGGGAGGGNSLEPCSFLNSCVATAARNR